jgi:hypothetical protein
MRMLRAGWLPLSLAVLASAQSGWWMREPKRQLRTSAHPLVEMTLMRQANRTLLHLVNLSGHSDTAYFDPLPMSGIRV